MKTFLNEWRTNALPHRASDKEIDRVRNAAAEQENKGGTKWANMTYEQGVNAALGWILGDYEDDPMPDE